MLNYSSYAYLFDDNTSSIFILLLPTRDYAITMCVMSMELVTSWQMRVCLSDIKKEEEEKKKEREKKGILMQQLTFLLERKTFLFDHE